MTNPIIAELTKLKGNAGWAPGRQDLREAQKAVDDGRDVPAIVASLAGRIAQREQQLYELGGVTNPPPDKIITPMLLWLHVTDVSNLHPEELLAAYTKTEVLKMGEDKGQSGMPAPAHAYVGLQALYHKVFGPHRAIDQAGFFFYASLILESGWTLERVEADLRKNKAEGAG